MTNYQIDPIMVSRSPRQDGNGGPSWDIQIRKVIFDYLPLQEYYHHNNNNNKKVVSYNNGTSRDSKSENKNIANSRTSKKLTKSVHPPIGMDDLPSLLLESEDTTSDPTLLSFQELQHQVETLELDRRK